MTMPYLAVKNVGKRFGDFEALRDVSLEISKGEFVTFLGPSGSGKTTTLMIIAGFEQATTGDVIIQGKSLAATPPYARNIGIVFQNYALFPHKNARDNVCFPLQMRSMARPLAIRKANDMLALVGLEGLGDRFPKQLSGGQQQRVALARALVFEPSLLLLDEPLGALDKNLREQMQLEIKRIQRTLGVTTIFVTHDQSEAMSMSDRIIVFDKGRVQQVDTPRDIYRKPQTNFVAGFIGESNLIGGTVTADGRTIATRDFGAIAVPTGSPVVAGDEVTVLIRPEGLELATGAAGGVDVTVRSVVNYGDVALVLAERGGSSIRMKVLGREAESLHDGQQIRIAWKADHVHVIAEALRG